MQAPPKNKSCFRSLILVLLFGATLAATWIHSTRLIGIRLHPTDGELSPRYTYYAIPIALSELVYNHDHDYTGYSSVSEVFWGTSEACKKPLKQLLAEATTLDEATVRSSPSWIIPADDKGLVDLTWLAFRLFGVQLKSLNSMFFLLLFAGSVPFVLDSFQRLERLALLVFLMASVYSATFLVHVTDQFRTVFEPRFLDVLSLIPTLHLTMIIADRRRATPGILALASVNIFLMLFIYHARATVAWQMLMIWVVNLAVWVIWGGAVPKAAQAVNGRLASLARLSWPSILLAAGLCASQGYRWVSYSPLYFEKHGSAHVFWHNTLMGLVCNSNLAKQYNVSLDDVDTIRTVEAYLKERGNEQTRTAIYGNPCCLENNFKAFDWIRYESVARDLYAELWTRHPGEMVLTYVYHKPTAYWTTFLWAMGWSTNNCALPAALGSTVDDNQRVQLDLYLNPFRWEVVGLVLTAFLAALPGLRGETTKLLLLVLVMLIFSAVPGMVAVPLIPYVNTTLVLTATIFYMGCAWMLILAMNAITNRRIER